MPTKSLSLFSEVKQYRSMSREMQGHLLRHPHDFARFQQEFNATVEKISVDLLRFELECIEKYEARVYRFQKIFRKRYRDEFLFGDLTKWTYKKPYGYAGDFHIIDNIYQNIVKTTGFDGLWDTYYLQMTACRATRGRKDELKKVILEVARKKQNADIRIMDLASGPARGIRELLDADTEKLISRVAFDCYDLDTNAIGYAKRLLNNAPNVTFLQKNAIRIALTKDIRSEIPIEYDLIYSAGLFDYLDARVAVRLISNLKRLLKKDGIMVIANFGDKATNTSAGLMEWVTEWYLIYRSEAEFRKIFLDAGVPADNLTIVSEQGGVILYSFVKGG